MPHWLSKDYKQETTSQQRINFLPANIENNQVCGRLTTCLMHNSTNRIVSCSGTTDKQPLLIVFTMFSHLT